ncbi:MAG TPA: hypothetical protein VLM85_23635 [Polyangiaceae bacterium]|nr:hypothetical protein [Polyangiaceae bacterium]
MAPRAATLLLCAGLAACGGANTATHLADPPRPPADRAELDRFIADEDRFLLVLAAADPRIAARTGKAPSEEALRRAALGALLAEDTTAAVEGNRTDVLSFEVRAHSLEGAAKLLASWRIPPSDPEGTLQPGLELELMGRLLASEKVRLKDERDLPRSAGQLLRGIASAWHAASDPKELAERDGWLSSRLAQIAQSLSPKSLTLVERDDLDDAIDPLERIVTDAMPKSQAALVKLRLAVQNMETGVTGPDRWPAVAERLATDSGSRLSAETLLALLGTQAKALDQEIGQLVGVKVTDDEFARAAGLLVAEPAECHPPQPIPSRVRALASPSERSFRCALLGRVIAAKTADDELDVLVAMHTATVVGAWAVVLARGADRSALPLAAPKPLAFMAPDVEARLLRLAMTRPVMALEHALAVEWLMRRGLAQATLRAQAWQGYGDAPLDVIERELHPEPRPRNALRETHGH